MQTQNKIISLQALRGIAFTAVFLGHVGYYNMGQWAVCVFFMLSGFLMCVQHKDIRINSLRGGISFSYRRIIKLYPLHLLMLIANILLQAANQIYNHWELRKIIFDDFLCKNTISHLLLLNAWIPKTWYYWNGPSWFLSAIFICYIFFPFIANFLQKKDSVKRILICGATILLIMSGVGYLSTYAGNEEFTRWVTFVFPLFRSCDFSIGCMIGIVYLKYKNDKNYLGKHATLYEAITILALGVIQLLREREWPFFGALWSRYTIIYVPVTGILIYLFAVNKGIFTRMLSNRVFVTLGDLSPYAFLVHFVAYRYVAELFSVVGHFCNVEKFEKSAIAIITFSATLIFSVLYKKQSKRKNI